MTHEYTINVRIIEFGEGGFVVTEIDHDGLPHNPTAVSTMAEAKDAIAKKLQNWNKETQALRHAQFEDEHPQIVAPRKWWRNA